MITDKSVPFSYRGDVVASLGKEIASSKMKVAIVHGGGSFGHTVARRYGLSSSNFSRSSTGVAETRAAMYELNHLVCSSLIESGVRPYVFAPFDIAAKGSRAASDWLSSLLDSGMSPTTFGDVSSYPGGFRVLSGDTIILELARLLKPERCIFTLDVDGIYQEGGKTLIQRSTPSRLLRLKVGAGSDQTGGIALKLRTAAKLAALGANVCFVSGFRRKEFSKALKAVSFYGTFVSSS